MHRHKQYMCNTNAYAALCYEDVNTDIQSLASKGIFMHTLHKMIIKQHNIVSIRIRSICVYAASYSYLDGLAVG